MDYHSGSPWWALFPPPWSSPSPELPRSTERFAGRVPYFNFDNFVLDQQWTVFGEKKRDFFCQPGFVRYVLPLHPGLYGVGCLPPLAQPHDGLVQPQHLPPCPRHFHFLKVFRISGVWFTEGPLPYAFFEYFFTTHSASMTALSIICSTRSGSWRDVFFKISYIIPYPPPRPSAVHILSSQTVYRTEKQCR